MLILEAPSKLHVVISGSSVHIGGFFLTTRGQHTSEQAAMDKCQRVGAPYGDAFTKRASLQIRFREECRFEPDHRTILFHDSNLGHFLTRDIFEPLSNRLMLVGLIHDRECIDKSGNRGSRIHF